MKKVYMQPTIEVVKLHLRTAMLTGSYGEGIDVTGIDEEPGDEEDFA